MLKSVYNIEILYLRSQLKGPSITTSNKYSQYATRLLCRNPESNAAKLFQEWNFWLMLCQKLKLLSTITDSLSGYPGTRTF